MHSIPTRKTLSFSDAEALLVLSDPHPAAIAIVIRAVIHTAAARLYLFFIMISPSDNDKGAHPVKWDERLCPCVSEYIMALGAWRSQLCSNLREPRLLRVCSPAEEQRI